LASSKIRILRKTVQGQDQDQDQGRFGQGQDQDLKKIVLRPRPVLRTTSLVQTGHNKRNTGLFYNYAISLN